MVCSPAKLASTIPCTESVRRLAHEHRVRLGEGLQTRREIHGVAENRDCRISTVLDLSNHRWPGVEADPHLRSHAVFGFEVGVRCLEPLQDRQAPPTRPQRRVLERNWRAENRHDAVAGKALNDAALLTHGFVHQLRQAAHKREGGFLSRPLRESS